MTEVFPNYYHKFECIAERCKHNCCIGWEIDIDNETMQIYESLNDEIGERIRNNIEGDIPHFILSEGERCPFLKENGLCEIICELGDGAVCDICYLHPRFKNFYSSFEETGLGLCCEEAVRIILSEKEPFSITVPDNLSDFEFSFLKKRQEIFSVLQNREKDIKERLTELSKSFNFEFEFSVERLYKMYLALERLDEKWTEILDTLADFSFTGDIFGNEKFQILFEQLSVYFIFRHFTEAAGEKEYSDKVKFAVVSCYMIGAICECREKTNGTISENEIFDIVRMYSSEIEYSEENIKAIFDYAL